MFDPPQTIEEAQTCRYGVWAGRREGLRHDAARCAYAVSGYAGIPYQCKHKPGKGPAGLYCGVHAKKAERKESND